MRSALLPAAAAALTLALGAARADRGDLFLSLAPSVDAARTDEPAFGGFASLQLGANEATDLFVEAGWSGSRDAFAGDADMETRILIGSFYTPFFGEIRPRFGGSGGMVHLAGPDGLNEVYLNLGLHLQGIYAVSDRFRLFAEAHPNITFGRDGEGSILVKAGFQVRLLD